MQSVETIDRTENSGQSFSFNVTVTKDSKETDLHGFPCPVTRFMSPRVFRLIDLLLSDYKF